MVTFRTFKRLEAARRVSGGRPILRVGRLYLAPVDGDMLDVGLESVELISPTGEINGQVSLRHLNRLGNANHAIAHPDWKGNDLFGQRRIEVRDRKTKEVVETIPVENCDEDQVLAGVRQKLNVADFTVRLVGAR